MRRESKIFLEFRENGRSGCIQRGGLITVDRGYHRICALWLKLEFRITRNRSFGGYWIGVEGEMSESRRTKEAYNNTNGQCPPDSGSALCVSPSRFIEMICAEGRDKGQFSDENQPNDGRHPL
jgi:hypothetical protein